MNDKNVKVSKKKLAILQQMKNQRIPGYKCKVKRSSWQLYCGAFPHEQLIAIPQIELNLSKLKSIYFSFPFAALCAACSTAEYCVLTISLLPIMTSKLIDGNVF